MQEPRIVNAGVDTLKINVCLIGGEGEVLKHATIPQEIIQVCQRWQQEAKIATRPVATTYEFRNAHLLMYPNSAPAWNYILRNDCLEIKLEPRLPLSVIAKITLQSSYLWTVSTPKVAVDEVKHFLITQLFGDHLFLQIAQLDLCVDVMNFIPPADAQREFLARPRKKQKIEVSEKHKEIINGRKLETIQFSGHGRPFSGKLYDKKAEIEQRSKKTWFHPRWQQKGWDGKADVWRMEFSIEREGFHDVKIEGVYHALENVRRLWAYCSQEWLRMVVPGQDKKRTRWATHPTWLLIQKAFDDYSVSDMDGLGPLVREKTRESNIEQIVAQIAGCATTLAAWEKDIQAHSDTLDEEIFSLLQRKVRERWRKTGIVVQDVVQEKKLLYSQA
ncbi:hypothetical protein EPA93_19110 [Ktedonosporobacter rubrisoli]|uniref:Replication initiation factor domain-containing protein n=1 Tax=Ktedonosporobacter rubrisoli TaxID=2509675 RepID=A0A4P6JRB2_KTERU|nr:hypothetical protein [Ktedonosporobacter rubrisoli]QBD77989.1 hypothetical protein EPA93_19110 [Ktedonosporobacter rubrisoli]